MSRVLEAAALITVGAIAGGAVIWSTRRTSPPPLPPQAPPSQPPALRPDLLTAEPVPERNPVLEAF
jgi:hypothetical protein